MPRRCGAGGAVIPRKESIVFNKQSITTALLAPEVGIAARGAVVMDDLARTEVMDRLEQQMLIETGIPVQVSWNFRAGSLACDRRDGKGLTPAQCRAWAAALERESALDPSPELACVWDRPVISACVHVPLVAGTPEVPPVAERALHSGVDLPFIAEPATVAEGTEVLLDVE